MIDVMKRLAELDAKNPNMISESSDVTECGGPMGLMGETTPQEAPKTPATLNVTAGSAEELGNMLTQIMQLAGVHKVEPEHLGIQQEPSVVTAEPAVGGEDPHSGSPDSMRSIKDKMNAMAGDGSDEEDDKEETDEGEEPDQNGIPGVDTTPNDPNKQKPFDPNGFAKQQNTPGGGDVPKDHESRPRVRTQPTATFEGLMREYKEFIGEAEEEETDEGMMDKVKSVAKKVGKAITGPDDEELIQRLEKQTGGKRPANIPTPVKANESATLALLKLAGLK